MLELTLAPARRHFALYQRSRVKLPLQHTRRCPLLSPKVKYCWHLIELFQDLPLPGGQPPDTSVVRVGRVDRLYCMVLS